MPSSRSLAAPAQGLLGACGGLDDAGGLGRRHRRIQRCRQRGRQPSYNHRHRNGRCRLNRRYSLAHQPLVRQPERRQCQCAANRDNHQYRHFHSEHHPNLRQRRFCPDEHLRRHFERAQRGPELHGECFISADRQRRARGHFEHQRQWERQPSNRHSVGNRPGRLFTLLDQFHDDSAHRHNVSNLHCLSIHGRQFHR